ncbi:MAG: magnesium/cobalt transporter CorA [Myxococcales bacterium]|nr:magnesium/cobalt transporter CorA [Myxococcales bacterium]
MKHKGRSRRHTRIPVPRRDPTAPPGALIPGPGAEPTRVRILAYGPQGVTEREDLSPERVRELQKRFPVVWVSLAGAGDAEVFRRVGDLFGLHALALEDMMSAHQRPKAEDYDEHLLVVLRHPKTTTRLQLLQVGLAVGPGFVLTVEEGVSDTFEPIRQRIQSGRGAIRNRGADYLVHAIVDNTLDGFLPLVEHFRDQLELIEEHIFLRPDERAIVELHSIRHDLYALRRVLTSTRDAIAALARSGGTTVSDATRVYLRDGQDHAAQLLDSVDACREHSVSLAELYDSRLNQRMNDIMKLLTLISTVFIPLSFITGVYGMNFETSASPWNMPELRWRYGYPFALGLMVCAALGLVWFFHRKGWLGTNGDDQPKTRGSSSGATRSS